MRGSETIRSTRLCATWGEEPLRRLGGSETGRAHQRFFFFFWGGGGGDWGLRVGVQLVDSRSTRGKAPNHTQHHQKGGGATCQWGKYLASSRTVCARHTGVISHVSFMYA